MTLLAKLREADYEFPFNLMISEGASFAPITEYLDGVVVTEGDYEFTLTREPEGWVCKAVAKPGVEPLWMIVPVAEPNADQRAHWGKFFFRVCNKLSDIGFAKRREANPGNGLIVIPL